MNLDKLKEIASAIIEDSELEWFDHKGIQQSIGIDWETMELVVIDMEHPDGPVIQANRETVELDTIFYAEED